MHIVSICAVIITHISLDFERERSLIYSLLLLNYYRVKHVYPSLSDIGCNVRLELC